MMNITFFPDTNSTLLQSKALHLPTSTYHMSFRNVDINSEYGIHFCSGVLITDENVLGTGRCLRRTSLVVYPLYNDVFVLTGYVNMWAPRKKIAIKYMEVHRNYTGRRNFNNDIAVVTVSCILYIVYHSFQTLMPFLFLISFNFG